MKNTNTQKTGGNKMNSEKVSELLRNVVEELSWMDNEDFDACGMETGRRFQDEGASISSFADSGMLTNNAGFILRMEDGSEFQVAVVRSR